MQIELTLCIKSFYHFTYEKGFLSLRNAAKSDFPLDVLELNTFCTSQRVVTPYRAL